MVRQKCQCVDFQIGPETCRINNSNKVSQKLKYTTDIYPNKIKLGTRENI